MRKLAVFIALWTIWSSCSHDVVFSDSTTINDLQWQRSDSLLFSVNFDNDTASYSMWLQFRHITGYPFQNLRVRLINYLPDGTLRAKDYNLAIRDEQNEYLGQGEGDFWDYQILLEPEVHIETAGKYLFGIQHSMDNNPVPFVESVGLLIRQNQPK